MFLSLPVYFFSVLGSPFLSLIFFALTVFPHLLCKHTPRIPPWSISHEHSCLSLGKYSGLWIQSKHSSFPTILEWKDFAWALYQIPRILIPWTVWREASQCDFPESHLQMSLGLNHFGLTAIRILWTSLIENSPGGATLSGAVRFSFSRLNVDFEIPGANQILTLALVQTHFFLHNLWW